MKELVLLLSLFKRYHKVPACPILLLLLKHLLSIVRRVEKCVRLNRSCWHPIRRFPIIEKKLASVNPKISQK